MQLLNDRLTSENEMTGNRIPRRLVLADNVISMIQLTDI